MDKDTAHVMLEGIQTRLRVIEALDLEARLVDLARAAQCVGVRKA